MMIRKGRKTPFTLSLIIIIMIILSTILLPIMAFACPSSPFPGCALAGHDCHDQEAIYSSRKILMGLKGSSRSGVVNEKKWASIYEDEKRNVPSGPDPLHHNGAPQKRPKTSP